MKRLIIKIISVSFSLLLFLTGESLHAQNENHILTFDEYINNVKNSNISYLAEKYSVDIAIANIKASKVFPDPELSASYSNNQNWDLQMGYGVDAELSYTLELGGKRKARILLAESEKAMTEALLEDYFRNLRADASIAYCSALKQKRLCEIQRSSYMQMKELSRADSLRLSLGTIMEVDAQQSKIEAAVMLNEVYAGEGDLYAAINQLLLFQGDTAMIMPDSIVGELTYSKREFVLANLIDSAQNNRADLLAALLSKDVSQNNLRLSKANRMIDLGLSVGGGYSSIVLNEIAPAPEFVGISAGVSIPIKFSALNRGEVQAASLAVEQSERQYQAIEMQIKSEVMQAYNQYKTTCLQVEKFNTGLIEDAESILRKKVYSYERGETNILELLNAQRTYNDVQISYSEALYDYAVALIEMERICGLF